LPIIILSAHREHEIALESIRKGAQDYLIKGQLGASQLRHSLICGLERSRIQEVSGKQATVQNDSKPSGEVAEKVAGFILIDSAGIIRFVSQATRKLLGPKVNDMIGAFCGFIMYDSKPHRVSLPSHGGAISVEIISNSIQLSHETIFVMEISNVSKQTRPDNEEENTGLS
jgi:PAS domain-containing protein